MPAEVFSVLLTVFNSLCNIFLCFISRRNFLAGHRDRSQRRPPTSIIIVDRRYLPIVTALEWRAVHLDLLIIGYVNPLMVVPRLRYSLLRQLFRYLIWNGCDLSCCGFPVTAHLRASQSRCLIIGTVHNSLWFDGSILSAALALAQLIVTRGTAHFFLLILVHYIVFRRRSIESAIQDLLDFINVLNRCRSCISGFVWLCCRPVRCRAISLLKLICAALWNGINNLIHFLDQISHCSKLVLLILILLSRLRH